MSRYPLSTPTRAASSLAYVRLVACIRSPAIRRADSKLVGARLVGPRLVGPRLVRLNTRRRPPDLTSGSGGPAEMDAYRLSRSREPKTSL